MKRALAAIVFCLAAGPVSGLSQSSGEPSGDAMELAASGRWQEAEAAFETLRRAGPLTPRQLDLAVEASTRLNHWDRVAEWLLDAARRENLTVSQRVKLYEAQLRRGDAESARRTLEALVRDRPDDENLLHLLAFLHLSQNRFPEAAAIYLEFLKRHPESVESRVNLALVDFRLERTEEAFAQLRKAFESDFERTNQYFYRQLARNMAPEGLAELIWDAKRELGLPDEGLRTHLLLAREYENLARSQVAIQHYELYLAGSPSDPDAEYRLARLYFQAGDGDKCRLVLARLVERPDSVGAAARLLSAELAVKADQIEEAATWLASLPESSRNLTAYRYLDARVAMSRGDFQRAEAQLKSVISDAPEMAEAYFHLAQVYLRTGRSEDGRKALAEFQKRR